MYIAHPIYQQDIERIITDECTALHGKTVFITGASGLVGSYIVDTLMYMNEHQHAAIKIVATFTSASRAQERFPEYEGHPLFVPVIHNMVQPITYAEPVDYIIHTAANAHPLLFGSQPVEIIRDNVAGACSVLEYAQKNAGARLLYLSTLEVYGRVEGELTCNEERIGNLDFTNPRSCYPESKRLCETLCYSYMQEYGVDVVVARLCHIYGPTVKLDNTKADVQFLQDALHGRDIVMKSPGLQRRPYCYVADAVSALLTIIIKGTTGEAYNVASEVGDVLLRDMAHGFASAAGRKVIFDIPENEDKKKFNPNASQALDNRKLKALGWEPKFAFEEGLKHTYEIKKATIS